MTVQFHNLPLYAFAFLLFNQIEPASAEPASVKPDSAAPKAVETTPEQPLKGFVEQTDNSTERFDAKGIWKGHIIELRRHPTIEIFEQNGTQVKGVYSGLLGKFPLTGEIDESSGMIQLLIDFSRSKLITRTIGKSAVAVFNGELKDGTINGTANFPEFREKRVHFEAHRIVDKHNL